METTYLSDFAKFTESGIAYIPIGTIEWHGNHLPLETDFLVAQKICEKLSLKFPGYILPPFYLGAYGSEIIEGVEMRGMDRKLKKKLLGNLYFLESDLLEKSLKSLVNNLKAQGFSKIIIVSGHGGSSQSAVLEKVAKDESVLCIDPYESVSVHHADEGETSVLWACYPEEVTKGMNQPDQGKNDLSEYYGYDIMSKSSLEYGKELIFKIIETSEQKVYVFLKEKNEI